MSSAPAQSETESYRGYRCPVEIIGHAVLYFRFHLSLRDVEALLAERGVTVMYETIRASCAKFGPSYAAGLRQRRAHPSDTCNRACIPPVTTLKCAVEAVLVQTGDDAPGSIGAAAEEQDFAIARHPQRPVGTPAAWPQSARP